MDKKKYRFFDYLLEPAGASSLKLFWFFYPLVVTGYIYALFGSIGLFSALFLFPITFVLLYTHYQRKRSKNPHIMYSERSSRLTILFLLFLIVLAGFLAAQLF